MGLEKTLKRTDIGYDEYLAENDNVFSTYPKKFGYDFMALEGKEVEDCGFTFAKYEVERLLDFVAMAYCEIKYGKLTDRLQYELELDIPVWDSGVVDKFLTEDEKKLVYEHLNVIKNYIKEHSVERPTKNGALFN